MLVLLHLQNTAANAELTNRMVKLVKGGIGKEVVDFDHDFFSAFFRRYQFVNPKFSFFFFRAEFNLVGVMRDCPAFFFQDLPDDFVKLVSCHVVFVCNKNSRFE